jgi:hypothetical protein
LKIVDKGLHPSADLSRTITLFNRRYNITAGELPDGGFDPAINASLNAEKDDA